MFAFLSQNDPSAQYLGYKHSSLDESEASDPIALRHSRFVTFNRYTRKKQQELVVLQQQQSAVTPESIMTISKLLRKDQSLLASAAITSLYNREYLSNFKNLNSIVLYSNGAKYTAICWDLLMTCIIF
jgi:hypothetical protein